MTRKQSLGNRITSVFLAVAILFGLIPLTALTASAASVNSNRAADPSTIDGWKQFFPITGDISTENAGGVWTDKSVFLDASAFEGLGITQDEQDSFLVALSAMAANMNVTGLSSVPTDSMLILDVSGSMNDNQGNNDVAEELVAAANESIGALLSSNKNNRVGVVLYSGPTTVGGSTSANDSVLILPLGRYTTGADGQYLNYVVTGNRETTETVRLDTDVLIEGTTDAPTMASKTVVGATYIQKGIATALEQFVAEDNAVTVQDPVLGILQRKPVIVLMSDGAPTVGSTSFTSPEAINLGNGSDTGAALGFVSQLTAAYAKAKTEEKYGTDALFYTLGLGVDNDPIALGVLDPDNTNAGTALSDFWTQYNNAAVGGSVTVQSGGRGQSARTVTRIETALEQNYVDQYFSASTENLIDVFENIVSAIQLQSGYFPTLISESEDLSGYVSFVDRIGEYMTVADIKGILIGDHLFSGADLASNFVPGGGSLGTYDNPTALGVEMVAAVRARLGIDSDDTARTLIGLAYENGQLSYTDENTYSNYIGWYANAKGEFLGFYNEGTTVLPEATGNADTDPVFAIRSYGYLGAVDESHGVTESDMMYATVQVRKNIVTGEELVTFAVPAALIPVVSYNVTLDENGDLSELTAGGATKPIRLVYEVAPDDNINSFNVKELVSADYLAENTNADGTINFYTNRWEHENTTGYGTVNTYSYFNPSRQNDKYYYLEDAPVYSDANGTLYTGETQPSYDGTFYRSYIVYKNNGSLRTETVYRPLSDAAKATAIRGDDGSWYIPKGNVHVNLDGYTVDKTENLTATLGQAHLPFVDTHNHSVNDDGYNFYVGATLGNNGRMTVTPETGIKLSKELADGAASSGETFKFEINNMTSSSSDRHEALLVDTDGTETTVYIDFDNDGKAIVELKDGQTLYIGGMEKFERVTVKEIETVVYVPAVTVDGEASANPATVTIADKQLIDVRFVNDDRGVGNLTVSKEVEHDFGQEYQIPEDKTFTMLVTLSGIGTASETFAAKHSGDSEITSITTDTEGKFTVTLKHGEQFEVFGLPAGTTANVVEQDPATGFTPAYWDNGVIGDGVVTVEDANTVSVIVVNDYQAAEVYPVNITVGGSKLLQGRDWQQDYSFEFKLQKLLTDGTWEDLADATAAYGSTTFRFDDAFASERYTEAGTYYYRVIETEPNTPLGGFTYDKTVHSFSVIVGDADMDGQLEITDVVASRPDTTDVTATAAGWDVNTEFTNVYSTSGTATVTIDLNKLITNNGGSAKSTAGYTFGLYDGETLVYISPATTDRGFARFVLTYDATGTYQYILKEIVPESVPAGWTYSSAEIPVTVVVSDDGDGTISAVIYTGTEMPADAGTSVTASFTNIYDPADTELDINFVNKEISGRDLVNGEFDFEVQNRDGTKVLEGTNNAEGKVSFNGTLDFDKVGTYFYNIVETSADGNGVVTDKTVYRIVVTVADNDGQLSASYEVVNASDNTITFKNIYSATPVGYSIVGTKELTGRHLLNDEFSFTLTEHSFNGAAVQEPISLTVKNLASDTDNIVFPAISYDKAGTYVYTVKEDIPDGNATYGISYDGRTYTVTVVIEDNGEGALEVKSVAVSGAGTALKFENSYKANPASAQFNGQKQLTGKVNNDLAGSEYEFELYNSDASWAKGSLRETVENTAGGSFTFTKIDFTTDEDQYFLVAEKNGGQTIDGVTYDDTVYRVWVEVTDDLKGQLHAVIHIYDGEGIPQDKILFLNVYEITGGAVVTLSGEKFIDGRDFKDSDSFSFELYEADESYNIGETPAMTAEMDYATHRYEFDLNYTAADVGNTYYYVVKEANAGVKANGITNSTASYQIQVEVRDNGTGGIETVAVVVNATTSTLNFVNEYEIETGTSVQFEGTKTLENKDLGDLKFTFNLIESDASWTVGNLLQSKQNNGADFAFDPINYMVAGDYYYLIAEADAGQTVNGITNDSAVYRIHVKVTDNLDGTLSRSVTMTKIVGETADAAETIAFTNIYTPKPADITVDIDIIKTVVNKGSDEIGPEGFEFLLKAASDGADGTTVKSDENGNAKFTLTFTADDIGKTFYYTLTEVDGGKANVTYSTAEYAITITVTLDEETNTITATVTMNEEETAEPVAAFENVYDYTPSVPDSPQTGDNTNMGMWIALMFISGGAALTLCVTDKKKKRQESV